MIRRTLIVASFFLMTGAPAAQAACPNTDVPLKTLRIDVAREALRCAHDEARSAAGRPMPALRAHDALTRQAQDYSQDMADRNYFSHRTPEGTDLAARSRAYGYLTDGCATGVGENLLYVGGERFTAGQALVQWMNSPGHRENILSPWVEVGFGIVHDTPVEGASGGVTITAEFGTRDCSQADPAGSDDGGTESASGIPQRNANGSRRPQRFRLRDAAGRRGGFVIVNGSVTKVSVSGKGTFTICVNRACKKARSVPLRGSATVSVRQVLNGRVYRGRVQISR